MKKYSGLSLFDRIQINLNTRLKVYDMLSSFVSSRISIHDALKKMQETEKMRHGTKSAVYKFYAVLLKRYANSADLGGVFKGFAPESEIMVLNASSKNIKSTLKSAIEMARIHRDINKYFYGAQIYPAIMAIVAYIFLVIYSKYMLPGLLQAIPSDAELSLLTKFAFFLHDYLSIWAPVTLVINIILFIIVVIALPMWKGPLRAKFDRFPPFNMYRIKVGCSWLIAISSLIKAGVKVDQSMNQLTKYATPYLKHRINSTLYYMKRGANLGVALTKTKLDFPDPDLVDLIGVHAQGDDFAESMKVMADEFAERGIEKIKTQGSIVRSLGLVIVASVALLITGISFSVTHDLTENAQSSTSR